jgi:DNA-binding NarL/FixJ family response regulator
MRSYWERIGVLGPTYRLVGRGWSNHEIAGYLGRSEEVIERCVAWIMRFLNIESRDALVAVASSSASTCASGRWAA